MTRQPTESILIVDFGSQVTQLIARRVRTCRLEPKALATAETWIAEQRALWEGRLDRLEDYLETLKTKENDR